MRVCTQARKPLDRMYKAISAMQHFRPNPGRPGKVPSHGLPSTLGRGSFIGDE